MGTSTQYVAPRTREWAAAKSSMTRFANAGPAGRTGIPRVMSAFVHALGGPTRAASSVTIASTARRLGGFLVALSRDGLGRALEQVGLADLRGESTWTIVRALVDRLAGAGETIDDAVARKVATDILCEALECAQSDAEIDDLYGLGLGEARVAELVERFVSSAIYERLLQRLGDRIDGAKGTSSEKEQVEHMLKDYIVQSTRLELRGVHLLTLDWEGDEGRALIRRVFSEAYEVFAQS